MPSIKILIVSHKPFKKPEGEYYVPIHAGRSVAMEKSKDGKINSKDFDWMLNNTIGDDSGDNISDKNRYYSECSALYWAWKNYDKLENPEYIGLMHYRRHFIFNNNYFDSRLSDDWHRALCYINENFIDENYQNKICLNDLEIQNACEKYDLIVSRDSQFDLINGYNIRENYEKTIPGVRVEDFDLMVSIIKKYYPQYSQVLDKNINGYRKSLYQMFLMRKDLFFEYCEFLFGVLFKIESQVNFKSYTTNGKRTLGYLAEILLAVFVWQKEFEGLKLLKLGVTEVEYPYDDEIIQCILKNGKPSYKKYLSYKIKSLFAKGKYKNSLKESYQSLRRQIKSYKKLKSIYPTK